MASGARAVGKRNKDPPGGCRKCGKQRGCGSGFLEVWQGKDLAADSADVWQIKNLVTGGQDRWPIGRLESLKVGWRRGKAWGTEDWRGWRREFTTYDNTRLNGFVKSTDSI